MLRKSLILGSMTLLLVMLFAFTGCEGPVGPAGAEGDPGSSGRPGTGGRDGVPFAATLIGPNVSALDLESAFEDNPSVTLATSVETVFGLVPNGKTLKVQGELIVAKDETLRLEGTIDIAEPDVILDASGVSIVGLLLWKDSAAIKGKGGLLVPYNLDKDGAFDVDEDNPGFTRLHFNSPLFNAPDSAFRYPGSVFYNNSKPNDDYPDLGGPSDLAVGKDPQSLSAKHLKYIYFKEGARELTVYNIFDLEPDSITAGRTLILRGGGNGISSRFANGTFSLSRGSTLVIDEGATLFIDKNNSSQVILSTAGVGNIVNNGTIDLDDPHYIEPGTGSSFINNGTIKFSTTQSSRIQDLIGLWGDGKIELIPNAANSTYTIGFWPLRQNLVITGAVVDMSNNWNPADINDGNPFDGIVKGKTVTINDKDGKLKIAGKHMIPAAIVMDSDGVLETDLSSDAILRYHWERMGNKGQVVVTGRLGEDDQRAGLSQDLVIPPGITLTLEHTSAKLKSAAGQDKYNVIVQGTLVLDGANADPDKDVIVEAGGKLSLTNGKLTISMGDMSLDGELYTAGGSLDLANPIGRLTVGDSGKITGNGGAGSITVDNLSGLKIYGEDGYTASGIGGKDFESALAAIKAAREILDPEAVILPAAGPLSPYNGLDTTLPVVGTVIISLGGGNSSAVVSSENGVGQPIALPVGIVDLEDSLDFSKGYRVVTKGSQTTVTDLGLPMNLKIGVPGNDDEGNVTIKDDGKGGNTQEAFFVVSFNSVRLQKHGLISPVLPAFNVGIKTYR
jgi:hypothetical protein